MNNDEGIMGPGTDLVISMFTLALILVAIVSGLYFESVNAHAKDVQISHIAISLHKQLEKKINDLESALIESREREFHLEEQLLTLQKENTQLREKYSLLLSQYQAMELDYGQVKQKFTLLCEENEDCGGSTKHPKRSHIGKVVYLVIQKSNNSDDLEYAIGFSGSRVSVNRTELHEILTSAKAEFGNKLYVAIDTEGNVYRSELAILVCEFRQYDYYEYHDKKACLRN